MERGGQVVGRIQAEEEVGVPFVETEKVGQAAYFGTSRRLILCLKCPWDTGLEKLFLCILQTTQKRFISVPWWYNGGASVHKMGLFFPSTVMTTFHRSSYNSCEVQEGSFSQCTVFWLSILWSGIWVFLEYSHSGGLHSLWLGHSYPRNHGYPSLFCPERITRVVKEVSINSYEEWFSLCK